MQQAFETLQYNECIFCVDHPDEQLQLMMNQALKAKHTETQQKKLTTYIDAILKLQPPSNSQQAQTCHKFRQFLVDDEREEFMRRQYASTQYIGKIMMLTEYYKFHTDVPRIVELGIQKIMGRYYDKKRQNDYRKVKKVLKEQQGLSITSVQGSQSYATQQCQKRSRYSTLLNLINDTKIKDKTIQQSQILMQLCGQIDKDNSWTKDKSLHISGSFHEDNLFEQYMKNHQQNNRARHKFKQKITSRFKGQKIVSKLNLKQLLKKRESSHNEEFKFSQDPKQRQKQNKLVYNTGTTINIRNTMFFSEGQRQTLNQQPPSKVDTRMKKKLEAAAVVNAISQYDSHQKVLNMIYKPTTVDTKKPKSSKIRTISKQPPIMLRERSKSFGKLRNFEIRNKIAKSLSENRLNYNNKSAWKRTERTPVRSVSIANIKKRVASSEKPILSSWNTKISNQRRPIQTISRYGSSDLKHNNKSATRSSAIRQLLNRKLNLI